MNNYRKRSNTTLKYFLKYYYNNRIELKIHCITNKFNNKHFHAIRPDLLINNNKKFKILISMDYKGNNNNILKDKNKVSNNKISKDLMVGDDDKSLKKKIDKIKKKLTRAISSIVHNEEKKVDEIIEYTIPNNSYSNSSFEYSNNYIIYHHGNGDEEDLNASKNILKDYNAKISIFPGISYGFVSIYNLKEKAIFNNFSVIELNNSKVYYTIVKAKNLNYLAHLNSNKNKILDCNINESNKNNNFNNDNIRNSKDAVIDKILFFIPTKLDLKDLKVFKFNFCNIAKPKQTKNYFVPGLVIIDNFISEEEEQKICNELENFTWNKLSNRKVQHFGYEFIYGNNNINKNNKINSLEDFKFLEYLNTKLAKELNKFCLNKELSNKYNCEFYNYISDEDTLINYISCYKENINEKNHKIQSESFLKKNGYFDQLTVNKYLPGQGIPPHVDSHSPFKDIYCSVSLLSGITMTFSFKDEIKNIYLKPRSIAFFTNELRYKYEHSISFRKIDLVENEISDNLNSSALDYNKFNNNKVISRKERISLTFRKIRTEDECNCKFFSQCDTYKSNSNKNSTILIGNKINESSEITDIEKRHVYAVYERIAPHFSHTRYKPWPKVVEFLNSLDKFSLVGDIGCGNGKYLSAADTKLQLRTIGTDRSYNLSKIALEKNKNSNVFVADSLILPFRDNVLDAAISIAVIHHFSNNNLRKRAIKEILRCVKKGGKFLIYVWALEQEDGKFKEQDNLVPWHLQNTYSKESKTIENNNKIDNNFETTVMDKDINDNHELYEPKGYEIKSKQSTVYHRYYHVFKKEELENLIKEIDGIDIIYSYYDHENWCCICSKL